MFSRSQYHNQWTLQRLFLYQPKPFTAVTIVMYMHTLSTWFIRDFFPCKNNNSAWSQMYKENFMHLSMFSLVEADFWQKGPFPTEWFWVKKINFGWISDPRTLCKATPILGNFTNCHFSKVGTPKKMSNLHPPLHPRSACHSFLRQNIDWCITDAHLFLPSKLTANHYFFSFWFKYESFKYNFLTWIWKKALNNVHNVLWLKLKTYSRMCQKPRQRVTCVWLQCVWKLDLAGNSWCEWPSFSLLGNYFSMLSQWIT